MEYAVANFRSIETAGSIVFVTMAENGTFDETTIVEHADLFEDWQPNVDYKAKKLLRHKGEMFAVLQAHRSQDNWEPGMVPALYKKIADPSIEYPPWSQPISAQDAYMTGDKCSDEGRCWVSTVDNNVWKPGVYGWDVVAE